MSERRAQSAMMKHDTRCDRALKRLRRAIEREMSDGTIGTWESAGKIAHLADELERLEAWLTGAPR